MKHLFTLKSLLLTLVMLCGLNAWGATAKLTFTAACGGSGTDDKGNTWTVTSDAAESNYDGTKGVHYGTNKKAVSYLQLTTTISGTITSIKVNASGASTTSAKLNVTVGGRAFGSESDITGTATEYPFKGNATGEIVVKLSQTKATKALYVKSIEVTYTTAGGGEAVTVEKPTFSLAGGTYYGTQKVEIQIPAGAEKVMYTTDGKVPSSANSVGVSITENTPITVSKTTTIKAIAIEGKNESAVAEATYTIEPSIANTKETALTTADAIALIDKTSAEQLADPTQKVYVKGVISKIDSYNSKYKSITYWLDGDAFMVYSGKGKGGAGFATVDDVAVGANVIVVGNLKKHNTTYEFDYNNELVEYTAPAGFVEKPVITETSTPDFVSSYYTTSTATATIASATEGATIKYAITDGEDPTSWNDYSKGAQVEISSTKPATKTLWAKADKDGNSAVASKEFTFIEKPESITFEQVTSESQIVPGRKYVIACTGAEKKAVMSAISGDYFTSLNTYVSYEANKLTFFKEYAVYVTFEKAAANFANGHANDKATTIWNVKIGDEYITQTAVKEMAMSADAPTNITMSIAEGNFVLKFGASFFSYNSSNPRFTTYNVENQGSATSMAIQLFREPEAMASVMGATAETSVELPVSVVGRKVFGNYLLASTVNNGGAQLESPSLAEAKHFWSNDPEKFNQESWIAIAGLDVTYVGKEFEVGQALTAAGAAATYGFPTYTVAALSELDYYAGELAINNYSASNFNIGGEAETVANVWLVAPQLGEYCQIHGYVDAARADAKKALVQANEESSSLTATVYLNGLSEFKTSGWYNIEGVVAKDGEKLAIYATAVDTATGVEGVETSSVKVYGAEGVINVESEEVAPIAVYSANGAIVSSVEASSASIAVAPGFYIVKAGNSVSKVTVK